MPAPFAAKEMVCVGRKAGLIISLVQLWDKVRISAVSIPFAATRVCTAVFTVSRVRVFVFLPTAHIQSSGTRHAYQRLSGVLHGRIHSFEADDINLTNTTLRALEKGAATKEMVCG